MLVGGLRSNYRDVNIAHERTHQDEIPFFDVGCQ